MAISLLFAKRWRHLIHQHLGRLAGWLDTVG
jgi:hypothetical protein